MRETKMPSILAKVKSSTVQIQKRWVMGFEMQDEEYTKKCLGVAYFNPNDRKECEICVTEENGGLIDTTRASDFQHLFVAGALWICNHGILIRAGDKLDFRQNINRMTLQAWVRDDIRKNVQMHRSRRDIQFITQGAPPPPAGPNQGAPPPPAGPNQGAPPAGPNQGAPPPPAGP